jgi:hypothetical protein
LHEKSQQEDLYNVSRRCKNLKLKDIKAFIGETGGKDKFSVDGGDLT